jgi:hypothetical protein
MSPIEQLTTASAVTSPLKRPHNATQPLHQQKQQLINSEKRKILHDRLGKQVRSSMIFFENSRSWSTFVQQVRGVSHIHSKVDGLPHPAAALLKRLQTVGVPIVTRDPPWTPQKLDDMAAHGPHKSANDYSDFVREEMAEFCEKGFWVVLPYDLVKQLPGLKLSPLGVVPQRERRPRLIVDYSFYGVNDSTLKLMPPEAMQFGRALTRILTAIRHANPAFGPVYMAKIDISDGFYRVWTSANTCAKLGVLLPQHLQEPQLVAFPLSLPMGWVESPPAFCAVTETAADLANQRYHRKYAPPHRLDDVSETQPSPAEADNRVDASIQHHDDDDFPGIPVQSLASPEALYSSQPHRQPLAQTDIYVDDFCSLSQGHKHRRQCLKRILMHTIDEILRPWDPSETAHQEPMSIKKMLKGDASWQTRKLLLGWLIDTMDKTILLPAHRLERLRLIFDELRGRKRVALKQWHKVLGELRSMVLAIPGGRGLFSTLQSGLQHMDKHRVRLSPVIRAQLDDFELLANDLARRPTRIAEIIPDRPSAIGTCDAAGQGMGGVWFTREHAPLLWRARFPPQVVNNLVTWDNPTGIFTNSDFEHLGVLSHLDVIAQHHDIRDATLSVLNDNVTALSRSRKGSVTSTGAAAYLLSMGSLHQRHYRYLALFDHIHGPANVMADDASRLWHLSDNALLAHFELHYPQTQPWQLCQLRPEMLSSLTLALHKKRPDPQKYLVAPLPKTTHGLCGETFAWNTMSTPYWKRSPIPSRTFKSSDSDIVMEDLPKMATPSKLAQWKTPCVRSARRWPAWGPRTIG